MTPQEVVILLAVAAEHIDVDIAMNAVDTAVGSKLPHGQFQCRHILAVARHPHEIIARNGRGIMQILMGKRLSYI